MSTEERSVNQPEEQNLSEQRLIRRAKLKELQEAIGQPKTIKEALGDKVTEEQFLERLDQMTEDAFDDQCTGANPRYPLMSEIKEMYLNAYYGRSNRKKK